MDRIIPGPIVVHALLVPARDHLPCDRRWLEVTVTTRSLRLAWSQWSFPYVSDDRRASPQASTRTDPSCITGRKSGFPAEKSDWFDFVDLPTKLWT